MKFLIAKFVLIIVLTICMRFIELCRKVVISTHRSGRRVLPDIRVLYRIGYLHLPMSMAAIGLMCDNLYQGNKENSLSLLLLLLIFILTVGGCISRGILSKGEPELVSRHDLDWLLGITVPNLLGLVSLSMAIF